MDSKNMFKAEPGGVDSDVKAPKYPVKDPEDNIQPTKAAEPEAIKNDDGVLNITLDDAEDEDESVVALSKTYTFNGEVIKEIDMSGLEDLGQMEAQKIEKLYKKFAKGNISVQPELTDEYAIVTAHYLTGLPLEFFKHMRHKDILKIRNRVINFSFGE